MANEVKYEVRLYVATRWATGSLRGTTTRVIEVVEEATILGGIRAIDKAVAIAGEGNVLSEIHSPEISPNPAAQGWEVGR